MFKLSKKSCRGCGSNQHTTPCCPNRPCLCCGEYHSRGVKDCPITIAALQREADRKEAKRRAANALKQQLAAAKRQQDKARRNETKVADVAVQNALYVALLPFGIAQRNSTYFTKTNWAIVADDSCLRCGCLPKRCLCL